MHSTLPSGFEWDRANCVAAESEKMLVTATCQFFSALGTWTEHPAIRCITPHPVLICGIAPVLKFHPVFALFCRRLECV